MSKQDSADSPAWLGELISQMHQRSPQPFTVGDTYASLPGISIRRFPGKKPLLNNGKAWRN